MDDIKEIFKRIDESILDPEKTKINPVLWDGDKLKSDVKQAIMSAIYSVLGNISRDRLKIAHLEGSNLTFFYTSHTDIDTHFLVDNLTEQEKKDLEKSIAEFNKKTVYAPNTKNNIELYLIDTTRDEAPTPQYNLLTDQWNHKDEKIQMSEPFFDACLEIAMTYARDCDLCIGELMRDIIEFKILNEEMKEAFLVDYSKYEDRRKKKINEIKADIESLHMKWEAMRDFRQAAFLKDFKPENESLFIIDTTNRNYTMYNVVFKMLQRLGYIDLLKILKHDVWEPAVEKKDFETNINEYIKAIKASFKNENF